jgi:hypothetical protein
MTPRAAILPAALALLIAGAPPAPAEEESAVPTEAEALATEGMETPSGDVSDARAEEADAAAERMLEETGMSPEEERALDEEMEEVLESGAGDLRGDTAAETAAGREMLDEDDDDEEDGDD